MEEDIAIKVENVSKEFKLPHEKQTSIKSLFVNMFRGNRTYERQKVLNDVSLEINKGDFFGIVGRNGSGKSTLLKLLAGIYEPNEGKIAINGTLTPFIELGVGFNPELTGRENVFLNGALLGFSRKEVEGLYDSIVEFAELGQFMDQKLKNYSSGMQVRLAFSIAIQSKSDILLLDEVLAVGDQAFQKKCISVFDEYKANKQTIILVTHDMSVVEKYCTKAILIDRGKIQTSGSPRQVARQYARLNEDKYLAYQQDNDAKLEKHQKIKEWQFKYRVADSRGKLKNSFMHGEQVSVEVSWGESSIKNIGIALLKSTGEYVYGTNTIIDKFHIKNQKVKYQLKLNLGEGEYNLVFGLFGDTEDEAFEFIDKGPRLIIRSTKDDKWGGITKLEHQWSE